MTKQEIKNLKYDEALELLKEISIKLENKEVSIDDLTTQVKLANQLAEHCKSKLRNQTHIIAILEHRQVRDFKFIHPIHSLFTAIRMNQRWYIVGY